MYPLCIDPVDILVTLRDCDELCVTEPRWIITVYVTKVQAHNQDNWFHDTAPAPVLRDTSHVTIRDIVLPRLLSTVPTLPSPLYYVSLVSTQLMGRGGGWRAAAGGTANCDLAFRWSLVLIGDWCWWVRYDEAPTPPYLVTACCDSVHIVHNVHDVHWV